MKPSAVSQKMVNSIATNCLSVRLRLMNRMVGAIYDEALSPQVSRRASWTYWWRCQPSVGYPASSFARCCIWILRPSAGRVARLKKNRWLQVEPSGEGKILKIEVIEEVYKKIEQVYHDWQRAQAKAVEVLGESTSEIVIASGNKHLLGGMIS